eukprot:481843-Lingulodinium_polyedra.AAC.1
MLDDRHKWAQNWACQGVPNGRPVSDLHARNLAPRPATSRALYFPNVTDRYLRSQTGCVT